MKIANKSHLTYCTNIHAGETWDEVFYQLRNNTLKIKKNLCADEAFGIGLRLSNRACLDLLEADHLSRFKAWLENHHFYVFTLNGFPYGDFHQKSIKAEVHRPDWTTKERLQYTTRLADVLAFLLPPDLEGGISTSPLSYKGWHRDQASVKKQATENLLLIVEHLYRIRQTTGKNIHLDIEPEPDGFIETSEEYGVFFKQFLERAYPSLAKRLKVSVEKAAEIVCNHIRLCFDICHFAVEFESPGEVIEKMRAQGFKIGKIQISSALKAALSNPQALRELKAFDEEIYLHQCVIYHRGRLRRFSDLAPALKEAGKLADGELRTHFHVPIFTETYGPLGSTQSDIIETLKLWLEKPFCPHLEVETYTWHVLPPALKTDLVSSIARELNWVLEKLKDGAL